MLTMTNPNPAPTAPSTLRAALALWATTRDELTAARAECTEWAYLPGAGPTPQSDRARAAQHAHYLADCALQRAYLRAESDAESARVDAAEQLARELFEHEDADDSDRALSGAEAYDTFGVVHDIGGGDAREAFVDAWHTLQSSAAERVAVA